MESACLTLPQMVANFLHNDHFMPNLPHMLLGVGKFCDANCNVIFENNAVTVLNPNGDAILARWRECTDTILWYFLLHHDQQKLPETSPKNNTTSLIAFSTYDLTSVTSLVHYLQAAAGFPIKPTWILLTIASNYAK